MGTKVEFKSFLKKYLPPRCVDWLVRVRQRWVSVFSYRSPVSLILDYDGYWERKRGSNMGYLSSFQLDRVRAIAGSMPAGVSVLDVGCGDGSILRYLIEHRAVAAHGVDVSERAVAHCRAQGLDVWLADVTQPEALSALAEYDYIILSEIIEHVPAPEDLLDGLRSHVRQAFIVSVPNTGYVWHRLRLLLGRFPLQWLAHPGEHLRFWTHVDFLWWANWLGYRVRTATPYQGTRLLKNLWPNLFASGMVYVLEFKE
jgi:methionine biosynthesis protein MetW